MAGLLGTPLVAAVGKGKSGKAEEYDVTGSAGAPAVRRGGKCGH